MNETELVALGIATVGGEEIVIVPRPKAWRSLVGASMLQSEMPGCFDDIGRCGCEADLHAVAAGRGQAVQWCAKRELRPSPARSLPYDPSRARFGRLLVTPKAQRCENGMIECHHLRKVASAYHDVTEQKVSPFE